MKAWMTVCGCVLACGSATPAGVIQTLDFENAFGPVGPSDIVSGPGDYDFGSVFVETPDPLMFNIGHLTAFPLGGPTPFTSDFLYLFTFGGGATFAFDEPILSVSFEYGQRFNVESSSVYGLFANGQQVATFTHAPISIGNTGPAPINRFAHAFAAPVTQFTLRTVVEGSNTGLGIDALRVETIPEPGAGLLAVLAAVVTTRCRRSSGGR